VAAAVPWRDLSPFGSRLIASFPAHPEPELQHEQLLVPAPEHDPTGVAVAAEVAAEAGDREQSVEGPATAARVAWVSDLVEPSFTDSLAEHRDDPALGTS
jgi:hypothetical protein